MPRRDALRTLVFLLVLAPLLAAALAPATGSGRATTALPTGSPTPPPGPLGPIAGIPGAAASPVATEGGGELVGVADNAYVSPTYGWRLTWDPAIWRVVSSTSVAFNDRLALVGVATPDQITFRASRRYGGDVRACLDDQIRAYQEDPSGSAVEVVATPAASGERAFVVLSLGPADESGLSPAVRAFLECRRLTPDGATLLAAYLAPPAVYDERFPLVTALLAAVEVPLAEGSGEAGVSGNTYLSPTWGWRLSWDPAIWTVEGASATEGVDILQLGTADHTVRFRAAEEQSGDAWACAEAWIDARRHLEGVADLMVTEGPTGDADRAWARLTFTYPAGGRSIEEYVECRSLVPDRAVLSIDYYAYADRFAAGWPLVEDLLAAIVLPAE